MPTAPSPDASPPNPNRATPPSFPPLLRPSHQLLFRAVPLVHYSKLHIGTPLPTHGMSPSYHEQLYEYNFGNETNPLPPAMSSTSSAFTLATMSALSLGFLLSLLLLVCISRLTTASNRAIRSVQRLLCVSDLLFYLEFLVVLSINYTYQRVPSHVACQVQGVAVHFFSTANFTTITMSTYDRYWRLRQLRDSSKPSSSPFSPAHWRFYMFGILPFLLVHALLPVITSGGYGIYVPKPSSTICFAGGGRGVAAHDVYPAMNACWFVGCFGVIIVASYHTLKIIHGLLSASNVQSTAAGRKRVEAERRAMLYAGAITLLFLTGETLGEPLLLRERGGSEQAKGGRGGGAVLAQAGRVGGTA